MQTVAKAVGTLDIFSQFWDTSTLDRTTPPPPCTILAVHGMIMLAQRRTNDDDEDGGGGGVRWGEGRGKLENDLSCSCTDDDILQSGPTPLQLIVCMHVYMHIYIYIHTHGVYKYDVTRCVILQPCDVTTPLTRHSPTRE